MADDDRSRPERSAEARRDDHAAIARLADDLLPALVAKLGASGLGELEVREGSWKVRIRMPERRAGRRGGGRSAGETGGVAGTPASAPAQGSGAAPRSAAYAAAVMRGAGALTFDPAAGAPAAGAPAVGAAHAARIPVVVAEELDRDEEGTPIETATLRRAVATAPAVGFFRPLAGVSSGARVRAGDRVGVVDVLGVGHEVVAPVDGRVGATLVEPGEPVEYGQEVVEIELLPNGTSHGAGSATADHAPSGDHAPSAAGAPAGQLEASVADAAVAHDAGAGDDGPSTPGSPAPLLTPEATA